MLKRNRKVTFRLNEGEWRQLKGHVQKSGLSQEAYLRLLISGQRPITDGSRSEGKSFPTGRLFFFANRAGVLGAEPLTRESCWQDSMLATTAQGAVLIPAGAGAYPTRPYLP